MSRVIKWGLVVLTVVLGVVYYFVDPSASRFMPRCLFRTLTGWDCPGCGSQRMIHALLHGNLRDAWHYNAFLLLTLPGILFLVWLEIVRRKHPRLYMRVHSVPVVIALCVAILLWTILRNTMAN